MRIIPADLRAGHDGAYTVEERAIFPLGADLRADPLGIEVRLAAGLADLDAESLGQQLGSGELNRRLHGLRRLVPALRVAFGLAGYAAGRPGGATASELLALYERFGRYRDRLADRYRPDAEWAASYGVAAGPMPYERRVGLYWNLPRARAFAAVATWQGMAAATGAGPIPFALADALAPTRAEAADLAGRLEAERQAAEARAASRTRPSAPR